MNEEKKVRGRIRFNKADKVIFVVLTVLLLVMAVLSVMSRFAIMLIDGKMYIFGAAAGLIIMLAWAGYAIVRRIQKKTTRLVVGTLLSVVLFILVTICITFISMVAYVTIPAEFDTVVNGEKQVVILRGYDMDEERMLQRYNERVKLNPESEIEQSPEDYGYSYYAYPKTMGIFYRADAMTEGEVYIGQNSEATLMIEWLDENTAHLFVANPEIGDGGDFYLYY